MKFSFIHQRHTLLTSSDIFVVTYRVTNVLPKLLHMLLFSSEQTEFLFFWIPLFSGIARSDCCVWCRVTCRALVHSWSDDLMPQSSRIGGWLLSLFLDWRNLIGFWQDRFWEGTNITWFAFGLVYVHVVMEDPPHPHPDPQPEPGDRPLRWRSALVSYFALHEQSVLCTGAGYGTRCLGMDGFVITCSAWDASLVYKCRVFDGLWDNLCGYLSYLALHEVPGVGQGVGLGPVDQAVRLVLHRLLHFAVQL